MIPLTFIKISISSVFIGLILKHAIDLHFRFNISFITGNISIFEFKLLKEFRVMEEVISAIESNKSIMSKKSIIYVFAHTSICTFLHTQKTNFCKVCFRISKNGIS